MQPSLRDGDRLLVRWGAVVRPGDVAVVRLPPDDRGRARPGWAMGCSSRQRSRADQDPGAQNMIVAKVADCSKPTRA